MENKTVLVTGIGGNVGQGIIRNIKATGYPIKIVGCNVLPFSAGNHLCDSFSCVPFAFDKDYIRVIQEVVRREKVDLIIPSTDYEVFYLSEASERLGCKVVASEIETSKIYLDKYESYLHHKKYDIPFATTILPSAYLGTLTDIIVKPREGRGSRGISINPSNLDNFSDEYVVQELHRGIEITTAFYVNKDNHLHGFITLERSLENGATNFCRVCKEFDIQISEVLNKIIQNTRILGSANLQCIVTDSGEIFPFEINCRISGTNSIRSQFGFDDVRYTLQEHLFGIAPDVPTIIDGVAIRMLSDIIYPKAINSESLSDNSSNHYLF